MLDRLSTLSDFSLGEVIADQLIAARERTHSLTTQALDESELAAQHSRLMSPLIWDFAHIGNQEELWLVRDVGGKEPIRSDIDEIYDAFQHARSDRPQLPLLDLQQSQQYLATVREKSFDVLDSGALRRSRHHPNGFSDGFMFGMIAQHEQQHIETMLATHQLRAGEPVLSAPTPPSATPSIVEPRAREVLIPAGPFEMGTSIEPWALDNERPAHQVFLDAYWIDRFPVSNQDYAAFIADGGYDDKRWWSPTGWQYRQDAELSAPLFWQKNGNWWLRQRFGRLEELPPTEPVQHVCWFEVEAYAKFAGRRLPTEAEWEKAARFDPHSGRSRRYPWGDQSPTPELANLGGQHLQPAQIGSLPAGASAFGVEQLIGDVWEWTTTHFNGYPGFSFYPYREYSEAFFGTDYQVLRGGSWASAGVVSRSTFRNWDFPIRRQIFAGFRCARSATPDER